MMEDESYTTEIPAYLKEHFEQEDRREREEMQMMKQNGKDEREEMSEAEEESEAENEEVPERVECKFFKKGACKMGSNCTFAHVLASEDGEGHKSVASAPLCKFFKSRAGCKAGSNCKFSHGEGDNRKPADTRKTFLEQMHEKRQAEIEEKQRKKEENEANKQAKLQDRQKWKKKLSQKTRTGQPVMKHQMSKILNKLSS
jgi:hypothetical protein